MSDIHSDVCCATLYDPDFATIGRFCRNTLVRYARRYNFDVVHSSGAPCERPFSWHKLLLIQELFAKGYEWVLWVDADAIIVDFDKNIMDQVEPDKDLYLVRHPYQGKLIPNAGIFLIRNSEWSRDLLARMWALEQYIKHPWWENAALLHLLWPEEFGYRDIHNPLGAELDTSKVSWLPENWNYLPRQTKGDPPIILHFAAKTRWKRFRKMLLSVNLAQHLWADIAHKYDPLDSDVCDMGICVERTSGKTLSRRKKAAA